MDVNKPDEKSIMTYVAQFSRRFPDLVMSCIFIDDQQHLFLSLQPFGSINKEHGELLRWVTDTRQRLTHFIETPVRDIQAEYKVILIESKRERNDGSISNTKTFRAFSSSSSGIC